MTAMYAPFQVDSRSVELTPQHASNADTVRILTQSLEAVQRWVEDHKYRGYDPGDGLTSWVRPLTFGNLFAERILQQVVWKSPFNLRPMLGVQPLESTKGRGFMAWGYLLQFKLKADPDSKAKALQCLDWLNQNGAAVRTGLAWGNHFDFSTRGGRMPAHEPTLVWSSLIGQAFLEAYELTHDPRHLDSAKAICEWILSVPRAETSSGTCLSYVGYDQSSIHNSNMLGAAMLARTSTHVPNAEYLETARAAMLYSCSRQNPDGSWFYGEEAKYRWIDNFHTGYNLDSLKRYVESADDETFRDNLSRGYGYFKRVFFDASGQPRYYDDKTYPVDIQCASQAIDTFSLFADEDEGALAQATRVAVWTIQNMQDPRGFFHYRLYRHLTAKTPYFHWGQATMFKALTHLLWRLSSAAGANEKKSKKLLDASTPAARSESAVKV
jgi:rhamnogalacturonyl hydrolase YesR